MKRSVVLSLAMATVLITISSSQSAGQGPSAPNSPEADKVGFKGIADLQNAVQIAAGFSQDRLAATIIFRNLDAQIFGKTGPTVGSRTQTVSLPLVNTSNKPLHVSQDIRGFVSLRGKSRAVLVVQSGGTTTLVNLAEARTASTPSTTAPSSPSSKEAKKNAARQAQTLAPSSTATQTRDDSFDFSKRLETDIPPGVGYQITFVLLVERDLPEEDDAGYVSIDSLDVEIASVPATAPRK